MKKIMFNEYYGLEQAVLRGEKTMTRRIIPIDETQGGLMPVTFWNGKWCGAHGKPLKRQPYKVGEVLAIAQAYRDVRDIIGDIQDGKSIKFMAGWNNKMFVKAELMPHNIKITDVRVERLQEISYEDCLKEGLVIYNIDLDKIQGVYFGYHNMKGSLWQFDTPYEAFHALINNICGRDTWENNPWVWVYSFERIM